MPYSGAIRFVCECGDVVPDGGAAVMHALEGHDVVRERFSLGEWRFLDVQDSRSVVDAMFQLLREDGEEPQAFIERLNRRTEEARRELERIEEAERALGVRE